MLLFFVKESSGEGDGELYLSGFAIEIMENQKLSFYRRDE